MSDPTPEVSTTRITPAPATRPRHPGAFLATPGWIAALVGTALFAAACWAILAPWQFGRHTERAAANASIEAAATAQPVPVAHLMSPDADPTAIWQPVTATGTFLPERQVHVRLRQDSAGQPSNELLVPMLLEDGSVLLVDRGYVRLVDLAAGKPIPELPGGVVTVTGRVQAPQLDPSGRPPQQIDGRTEVTSISADVFPGVGEPVLRGFIQLTGDSPGALSVVGLPQVDSGPFLSYALQWCAFGAMAVLGMAFFVYREWTDPRDGSTGAEGTEQTTPRSRSFDRSELYDRP